jgi:toxin-antitoxin system PIN domain toxin
MRCVDVNLLVYAHRPESPDHERYRAWLERVRRDDEPLALSGLVLSGFVRVVSHHRVFREPTPRDTAIAFVDALRASPNAVPVSPGERHWGIFLELCREIDARGNDVADAYLAAIAVEHGATWYSADRGFARFRSLRWSHPLDAGA